MPLAGLRMQFLARADGRERSPACGDARPGRGLGRAHPVERRNSMPVAARAPSVLMRMAGPAGARADGPVRPLGSSRVSTASGGARRAESSGLAY